MNGLIALVVIVMAAGVAATLMIGQSKSNKEGDPEYFRQTGRKWLRLGGIYAAAVVVVCIILVGLWNG